MIKLTTLTDKQILNDLWRIYIDRWQIAEHNAEKRNYKNRYFNERANKLLEIVSEIIECQRAIEGDNKQ